MQETLEGVLDMADRLHLNCLTQKCEDMLSQEAFEITTGQSTTDNHSVVRWAYLAQKYHLVVCLQPVYCQVCSSNCNFMQMFPVAGSTVAL